MAMISNIKNTLGIKTFMQLALALLLAVGLGFVAVDSAWAKKKSAEEPDPAENMVNPQQLPDSSFIYDTPIYDLNNSDTYYANQTVQITGEVVGDRIKSESDSSKCWITLSALPDEQPSTIQVYVSRTDSKEIDTYGRYGYTGSTVIVKGVYNLVCTDHDGLSDIHADSFTLVAHGSRHKDQFNYSDFITAMMLVLVGLGLVIYHRTARERMR